MKTFLLPAVAVAAFVFVAAGADSADAGGVHFRLGGLHVDVGHPHTSYYRSHRWGGCRRGGAVWHDTSHYDWHPTEIVPHGRHWHAVPGHWDYHRSGHWDHYRW